MYSPTIFSSRCVFEKYLTRSVLVKIPTTSSFEVTTKEPIPCFRRSEAHCSSLVFSSTEIIFLIISDKGISSSFLSVLSFKRKRPKSFSDTSPLILPFSVTKSLLFFSSMHANCERGAGRDTRVHIIRHTNQMHRRDYDVDAENVKEKKVSQVVA